MSGSHAIEVCETGVGFRFLFHSVLYNLNSEVQKVRNWIGSTRESELPYNKMEKSACQPSCPELIDHCLWTVYGTRSATSWTSYPSCLDIGIAFWMKCFYFPFSTTATLAVFESNTIVWHIFLFVFAVLIVRGDIDLLRARLFGRKSPTIDMMGPLFLLLCICPFLLQLLPFKFRSSILEPHFYLSFC